MVLTAPTGRDNRSVRAGGRREAEGRVLVI